MDYAKLIVAARAVPFRPEMEHLLMAFALQLMEHTRRLKALEEQAALQSTSERSSVASPGPAMKHSESSTVELLQTLMRQSGVLVANQGDDLTLITQAILAYSRSTPSTRALWTETSYGSTTLRLTWPSPMPSGLNAAGQPGVVVPEGGGVQGSGDGNQESAVRVDSAPARSSTVWRCECGDLNYLRAANCVTCGKAQPAVSTEEGQG